MEPKIEPKWIGELEMVLRRHKFNRDEFPVPMGIPAQIVVQIMAIIRERVPSSPAPRLEFQADRMTETEWSADTWLVLPSGKREVLGWIPCDSQEEADEKVANLTKLYAEAVPSSPAAQKRTLVQQNLVIAAEIHCAMIDQECIPFEGERYFPALSTQKLERILGFHAPPDESIVVQLLRTELLQYSEEVKHLREQLDSPAAPTPPQVHYDASGLPSTADIDRHGLAFGAADVRKAPASPCGEIVANAKYEYKLPSAESGSITVDTQTGKGSGSQQVCNLQSTSGVPDPKIPCCAKREIVAKGVCYFAPPDSRTKLHSQFEECINWHHTHNVCLGCGREEPV